MHTHAYMVFQHLINDSNGSECTNAMCSDVYNMSKVYPFLEENHSIIFRYEIKMITQRYVCF